MLGGARVARAASSIAFSSQYCDAARRLEVDSHRSQKLEGGYVVLALTRAASLRVGVTTRPLRGFLAEARSFHDRVGQSLPLMRESRPARTTKTHPVPL